MKDSKPDAMFVFVPAGQGGNFMKQYAERGLDKSGIKVIGPGDVMDDDLLNNMGDAALGAVTAHLYSAAHPSQMNKDFVAAYRKAFGSRPGFMAVSGYDGIHLIYEALKKTGGDTNGDKLIEAMKGMKWESPRGPISIDPETRDIVQNIYIRKVEKVDGELYNVEFATFEAVKDCYPPIHRSPTADNRKRLCALRDADPWGRANNATGVIRRYTEARRRITASGYSPYAMPPPGVGRIMPSALSADTPKPGGG
ncbi:ABC transporter substrate-binding protein [Pseudomonas aeruginosa]|uniref:ABC transporter substrate-binding protein n=1 Tax=Pseudomonas aeruginosa TaxID=287 RepID=UPI002159E04E|nr:ABC transporter substrate-binding protein [Pseudomonas aeruginosa]